MGVKRDITRADLAEELGMAEDSIGRHLRRGAPHSRRKGRLYFNVPEYRAWMASEGLTGERGRTEEPTTPDLEAARLRKENALAAKYELQVARERGQLLQSEEVKRWVMEHFGALRAKLLALGDQLAPSLEGRDAAERAEIINGRIRDTLTELAHDAGRLGAVGAVAAA